MANRFLEAKQDKFMIDQSGKIFEIVDGYYIAEGLAREVVEIPKDGLLEIEFETIGKVKW